MKKIIFTLIISIGLILSISALSTAACDGNACYGKVIRLSLTNSNLFIGTDGDEKLLNCTAPYDTYVIIPTSDKFFNEKYALLLTAVSLNKNVYIRINELSPDCSISYLWLDNF